MKLWISAALAATAVTLGPAVPAHASAPSCGTTAGGGVYACSYTALEPVGKLVTSGSVYVIVQCTVGGTSQPGLYPQAGTCSVYATFSGPGSFEAGNVTAV